MRKRIVLTTFGSLGDLHPYIAIALGLKDRGHDAIIATSRVYQEKIERAGLCFRSVRPDLPTAEETQEIVRRVMDPRRGPAYLFKRLLLPALRDSYEDLMAATDDADLLVAHMITLAAPLVAEKRSLRWVSSALQPSIFLSASDPPAFAGLPWLAAVYRLGTGATRAVLGFGRAVQSAWLAPVRRFRRELGLPAIRASDLDMQVSPFLHLALFSHVIGTPQPDWPRETRQTGFCFYDRLEDTELKVAPRARSKLRADRGLSPEIDTFLKDGRPPLVFTLGSSAVMNPGSFFRVSIEAAGEAGERALLLVGVDPGNLMSQRLPDTILAAPYAPYSEVFGRSAAIIHQGGVGTTGQALRAGRPQLVVPFAYDQPDNAARVARIGAALVLELRRYTPERAANALRSLLDNPAYNERAVEIGRDIRQEDGVRAACDAIEEQLGAGGMAP